MPPKMARSKSKPKLVSKSGKEHSPVVSARLYSQPQGGTSPLSQQCGAKGEMGKKEVKEPEEEEDVGSSGDEGEEQPEEGVERKRMKKKQKKLTVNLTMCRYKVVADCCKSMGWAETQDENDWNLFWTDLSVGEARCMKLKRLQKINHFPGMSEIAHKCKLALNLNRMRSKLPHLYNFHPETFNLPVDYKAIEKEIDAMEGKPNKTYIVKPNEGACGVGIFLTRKLDKLDPKLKCVVQRYITRPLIIDNRKFDMRVYCLVTSMSPLRAYIYYEGLARFATEEYQRVNPSNMDKAYMHLTNYSVNKNHSSYQANQGTDDTSSGSKRSLASIWAHLRAIGIDPAEVWEAMEKVRAIPRRSACSGALPATRGMLCV